MEYKLKIVNLEKEKALVHMQFITSSKFGKEFFAKKSYSFTNLAVNKLLKNHNFDVESENCSMTTVYTQNEKTNLTTVLYTYTLSKPKKEKKTIKEIVSPGDSEEGAYTSPRDPEGAPEPVLAETLEDDTEEAENRSEGILERPRKARKKQQSVF